MSRACLPAASSSGGRRRVSRRLLLAVLVVLALALVYFKSSAQADTFRWLPAATGGPVYGWVLYVAGIPMNVDPWLDEFGVLSVELPDVHPPYTWQVCALGFDGTEYCAVDSIDRHGVTRLAPVVRYRDCGVLGLDISNMLRSVKACVE